MSKPKSILERVRVMLDKGINSYEAKVEQNQMDDNDWQTVERMTKVARLVQATGKRELPPGSINEEALLAELEKEHPQSPFPKRGRKKARDAEPFKQPRQISKEDIAPALVKPT